MIEIGILRRLLGLSTHDQEQALPSAGDVPETTVEQPATPGATPPATPAPGPSCPYCGILLDPPPTGARRCTRCRQRIVVRHANGRALYLTEAAVPVFEGERQRTADEHRWASERRRWLHLAKSVGAPADRRQRIERASVSAEAVGAARTLYLSTVERAVRAARRARRWSEVAVIRREQAAALFDEAGSPVPPPDDVVQVYREAASAALRALAGIARQADLVGAGCCPACRADDGKTFRITDELRVPRLPHPGCPHGLCACDWFVATEAPKRRRRLGAKRAKAAAAVAPADPGGASSTPADAASDAMNDSTGPSDDPLGSEGPAAT